MAYNGGNQNGGMNGGNGGNGGDVGINGRNQNGGMNGGNQNGGMNGLPEQGRVRGNQQKKPTSGFVFSSTNEAYNGLVLKLGDSITDLSLQTYL